MKKVLALVLIGCAVCVAQTQVGKAYSYIGETSGTTNYLGMARTTENSAATPSTNDAVWKIVRTITDGDGNVLSVKNAYGSGTKDNSLWTTAWTNRAAATYK